MAPAATKAKPTIGTGLQRRLRIWAHVRWGVEEIAAVVAAWRAGAISRETMLERLRRGEVLPDGRSVAQERELIYGRKDG